MIYTKPYGFAYSKMDADGATISDMVYGDVLAYEDRIGDYYKINFPDGRVGFILRSESQFLTDWVAQRNPTQENSCNTATLWVAARPQIHGPDVRRSGHTLLRSGSCQSYGRVCR